MACAIVSSTERDSMPSKGRTSLLTRRYARPVVWQALLATVDGASEGPREGRRERSVAVACTWRACVGLAAVRRVQGLASLRELHPAAATACTTRAHPSSSS